MRASVSSQKKLCGGDNGQKAIQNFRSSLFQIDIALVLISGGARVLHFGPHRCADHQRGSADDCLVLLHHRDGTALFPFPI